MVEHGILLLFWWQIHTKSLMENFIFCAVFMSSSIYQWKDIQTTFWLFGMCKEKRRCLTNNVKDKPMQIWKYAGLHIKIICWKFRIQSSRVNNWRILRIKNENFSGYCFYINPNIQWSFQICISVPLNWVINDEVAETGLLWKMLPWWCLRQLEVFS